MNEQKLVLWLADEFHDWIDGDHPVESYSYDFTYGNSIYVKFESGDEFTIEVTRVYE